MATGKKNRPLKSSTRQQAAQAGLRLRAEAEGQVANAPAAEAAEQAGGELLQQLQVHQVELAMQNQALREAQEALLASRDRTERYRRLADDMPLFITAFLPDGTLSYVNDALCNLVGMTRAALAGRNFFDFLRVDDREMVRARLALLTPENPTETHEQRYPWYGEAVAEHQWTSRAFFDAAGRVVSYQAFGEDITERKCAEEALREQAQFFRLIAENIGDFIAVLDLEGRRLYNSPSYRRFFGATRDLRGTDSFVEIHPEDQERVKQVFRETVETGIGRQTDYRFLAADGSIRDMESHGSVIKDSNGRITRVVVVSHDVTERKEMEKKVEQLAFYDPLTKLPNRRLLSDRLNQIMAASARSACYGALMFIDLDNFKPLNDRYGHMVGDLLLIEASARLKTCVREADTVARFGGDEFVVILSELDTDKVESVLQASVVAEKIHRTMAEPYLLTIRHDEKEDATVEYQCTSSIGVVLFIDHQSSQDDILEWADAAMYQAKQAGRNLIRFHVEKA